MATGDVWRCLVAKTAGAERAYEPAHRSSGSKLVQDTIAAGRKTFFRPSFQAISQKVEFSSILPSPHRASVTRKKPFPLNRIYWVGWNGMKRATLIWARWKIKETVLRQAQKKVLQLCKVDFENYVGSTPFYVKMWRIETTCFAGDFASFSEALQREQVINLWDDYFLDNGRSAFIR